MWHNKEDKSTTQTETQKSKAQESGAYLDKGRPQGYKKVAKAGAPKVLFFQKEGINIVEFTIGKVIKKTIFKERGRKG